MVCLMFLRQKLMLVMVAPLMLAVKSARHHTHSYITMQCASRAEYIIACSMLMRKTIRRSVIVALALTGAANLKLNPQYAQTQLNRIDPSDLSEADRGLVNRPILYAFKYEGDEFELPVELQLYQEENGLSAVADRTQMRAQRQEILDLPHLVHPSKASRQKLSQERPTEFSGVGAGQRRGHQRRQLTRQQRQIAGAQTLGKPSQTSAFSGPAHIRRLCDFYRPQMTLPERPPHLAVGVTLQHAFDQFALIVEGLVTEGRHGSVDRGHPQHFLEAGLTADNASATIGIDAGALFSGKTQQRLLALTIVNRFTERLIDFDQFVDASPAPIPGHVAVLTAPGTIELDVLIRESESLPLGITRLIRFSTFQTQ